MHTRQGAAVPALPHANAALLIEQLRQALAPNWAPIEKLCPPGLCEQFMFMGKVDGIHLYKHVDTRRYLNIDASGATYAYDPAASRYLPISITEAMWELASSDRQTVESLIQLVERVEGHVFADPAVKLRRFDARMLVKYGDDYYSGREDSPLTLGEIQEMDSLVDAAAQGGQ